MRHTAGLLLALVLTAVSPSSAQPVRFLSTLDILEAIRGAVAVERVGPSVVLKLEDRGKANARLFMVEADREDGLPETFRVANAEILYWAGHLVLIEPDHLRAWHFSMPKFDALPRTAGARGFAPDRTAVDEFLDAHYELISINSATSISSSGGPRALEPLSPKGLKRLFANDDDQQDLGSGGLGTCGRSCSQTCGDGSHCAVSCNPPRCAHCVCPASCYCD